jgi:L-ascorbate metabolism protein UlaG (beta-lactamase superfamily)
MLDGFTWFKQSAYRWDGDGRTVYIDPWGLDTQDPADAIFITHAHFDHFSLEDIDKVRTRKTRIVAPSDVALEISGEVTPVVPGDSLEVSGIKVQAVPAYNVVESRLDAHPKDNRWVGYLLTLGSATYYHAGDTDHLPELSEVRTDVAFLPIGGTYTMDASEAAGMAKAIGPQVAVPMHYGFVVGTPADAERFAAEADPVKVHTFTPVNPFEK